MDFDDLVRRGLLRAKDHDRFTRATAELRWRANDLGYLDPVMPLARGALLVAEHFSGGWRLRVLGAHDAARLVVVFHPFTREGAAWVARRGTVSPARARPSRRRSGRSSHGPRPPRPA